MNKFTQNDCGVYQNRLNKFTQNDCEVYQNRLNKLSRDDCGVCEDKLRPFSKKFEICLGKEEIFVRVCEDSKTTEEVIIRNYVPYRDGVGAFVEDFGICTKELRNYIQGFDLFSIYVLRVCCLLLQLHSLLRILLSLEVISLIICFNFTCRFVHAQGFGSFVLVFLCFEVSIISVLLSMIVALVKTSGSDYVGMLSPRRAF